ncbi:unnamed protein product, partial [Rotaria magnacalcarata]
MGSKQSSSEINGVPCSGGCECTLPTNDFNFDRILNDSPRDTYCFYTKTTAKVRISTGATFETNNVGGFIGVDVEAGEKIYVYFRRRGTTTMEYFCWDCLVAKDEAWARSLYLSLIDR